ncbi:MAG: CotH kinase family protein [Candidatus Aegiribacteria sp.]|nr:CotH kinase family protein [Candidatus Aegiribacteria sp.]
MKSHRSYLAILVLIISGSAAAALEPPVHPLFDGDQVHEFHLTFEQSDWWEQLENNYASQIYIEASFDWESIHLDSIGVRFKGGSSYFSNMTMKKSFKLDIDAFIEGQEIYGLDKLNLNCNFNDPSFVREMCGYELCRAIGLPTERTNFVALYINNTYWGLYTLVEQYDQEFIDSRFGDGENGNLWKGDEHGSLEYLGSSQAAYYSQYELKTNEEENDWTALIDLVYGINNTPSPYLLDSLSGLVDINSALVLLAVDNLVVNLDSYAGRCCNYYLYNRERDDRFVFADWDMNESWGVFNSWGLSIPELRELNIEWVSPDYGEERPLAEKLWSIDEMLEVYKGHLRRMLAGEAHPDEILPRMEELREFIAPWVYMETPPRMLFTADEFDAAMTTDIEIGGGPGPARYAPGLQPFIEGRYTYLTSILGTWNPVDDLVLNELMAKNDTTVQDNYGEYDDWLEITNRGTEAWNLEGFYLTDDMAYPHKFAFPDTAIGAGEYLVVWADNDPGQGSMHAEFKLDADGEDLFLLQDYVIVDFLTFPEMEADEAYGRYPDAIGSWQFLQWASPGGVNGEPTGVADLVTPAIEILSVYPNPAWSSCSVVFELPQAGCVDVSLYDASGKLMLTENLSSIPAGNSSLELNVSELPSGMYFVNLRSGLEMDTVSLVVLR